MQFPEMLLLLSAQKSDTKLCSLADVSQNMITMVMHITHKYSFPHLFCNEKISFKVSAFLPHKLVRNTKE